jgi:hypothetical protein
MTVVFAQTANAFACRSFTRWPGAFGWTTNRLLIPAPSIELAFSLLVLVLGPVADELGHANPPAAGCSLPSCRLGCCSRWTSLDKRSRAKAKGRAAP